MDFLAGPSKRSEGSTGGPVTYRHLLNHQSMTVSNPLRVIAHCDIDAAYAQFEQVRLGLPDDIPLICAQWQSIIAVNYPARKYGIKRFNTIDEAKKMCPHLHVQHVATYRNGEAEAGYWGEADPRTHKVSLDPYRRESLKILAIFKEMIPKGEIEKASIDEAFLDLSLMVAERLLDRFPHLKNVPEDAPSGLDSPLPPPPPIDWTNAGNVFPIHGEGEKGAEDGALAADKSCERPDWEDWALCVGADLMGELRSEVHKRLHYTCSAGIAHNKAMAKLCSAWKKPNNQTVLRAAATPAFLRDMDFTDIRFLGGKLGSAMATEFGAKTVGDMLTVPLEDMQKRFGEESIWVYNILRGIDHSEVTARVATKSMLASKNVRPSVTTPEQGHHWLQVLAGELNVRLRDARDISPGLWPKTLVLSHRTGIEASKSRQTAFPFTRNLSTEYILKYARKLWDEVTQPMNKGNMKLNNIALAFSGLERLEDGQKGIENFFNPNNNAKAATATATGATVKRSTSPTSRGVHVPTEPSPKKPRLPTLHTGKRKTALDSFLARPTDPDASPSINSGFKHDNARKPEDIIEIVDDSIDLPDNGWKCPRCKTVIKGEDSGNLKEQIQEHEDYHFALELQNGPSPARLPKPSKTGSKSRPEGIKRFFEPKSKS
ncbi:hypothetical protein BD324DRAFT_621278 [Kockovaella imperatae]|uniref:DNA polymerase eta n=1 Tax=Kockovaella imperatae TaxID=4999 RepID=A0A1Y1UKF7_9TREE|nr:hypothetical protein BD324DRAFT_621278 [Kockovaella imperatae]ORX38540.1 hypothetical protein BD324DRAFT_621278 [Kockovaella imperatae]